MRTIRFRSCKVSPSLPLERIAAFFRLKRAGGWTESLELGSAQLEEILKKQCGTMQAYLYEFGCVTFVDFDDPDVMRLLEFLEGIEDRIDYTMAARYAENHQVEVDDEGRVHSWPGSTEAFLYEEAYVPGIATLLAKSAALNKIESDINRNLDDSEAYIEYLRRGRLRMNKNALGLYVSKFLKFEYESIHSVGIFNRSVAVAATLNGRRLHDAFAAYLELGDRFETLQNKIESLRHTMKAYNSLSHRQTENRLYLLEIFLLGLFPVMYIVRWALHS